MATKAQASDPDQAPHLAWMPPPVEDGTDYFESLGGWIDDFMGDDQMRRRALWSVAQLSQEGAGGASDEPELSAPPSDPAPTEVPPPVPGGTETETREGETPDRKPC